MSRRMANEFKPQMDGNGPQPKKRRKASANTANTSTGNNTASMLINYIRLHALYMFS